MSKHLIFPMFFFNNAENIFVWPTETSALLAEVCADRKLHITENPPIL